MVRSYEQEQAELTDRVKLLRGKLAVAEEDTDNVSKLLRLVCEYTEISELTPEIVRKSIEKMIARQTEHIDGKKIQTVEIICNGIDAIPALAP